MKNRLISFVHTSLILAALLTSATLSFAAGLKDGEAAAPSGVELVSVKFTSDHGVLTNYNANFQSGGTRYSALAPEQFKFNTGVNHPMTHTRSTKIKLTLGLRITRGVSDSLTITGTGVGNYSFTGKPAAPREDGITYVPMIMDAEANTYSRIQKIQESIQWQVKQMGDGRVLASGSSGPHTIYFTYGMPRQPLGGANPESGRDATVPTLKRVDASVTAASSITSTSTYPLVLKSLISSIGRYTAAAGRGHLAEGEIWKAWLVSADRSGADCLSIANYAVLISYVLGIPGDYHAGVFAGLYKTKSFGGIPAVPNRPTIAVVADLGNTALYQNADFDAVTPNVSRHNQLSLVDGSNLPNRFEGYIYYKGEGENPYFFPAGVPNLMTREKNDILQVFSKLSWYKLRMTEDWREEWIRFGPDDWNYQTDSLEFNNVN